jgi:hypothetical protein
MATTQCFRTVFNASGHPPPLQFEAFGLIFFAIGVLLLVFRKSQTLQALYGGPRGGYTVMAIFMVAFATLWTTVTVAVTVRDWWAVNFDQAQVIEGPVEQFHPMPFNGHETEHFVVDGRRFDYSDYQVTSAFNQTSSHGGPIRAGLLVRIHFVDFGSGPAITRLDVAC